MEMRRRRSARLTYFIMSSAGWSVRASQNEKEEGL